MQFDWNSRKTHYFTFLARLNFVCADKKNPSEKILLLLRKYSCSARIIIIIWARYIFGYMKFQMKFIFTGGERQFSSCGTATTLFAHIVYDATRVRGFRGCKIIHAPRCVAQHFSLKSFSLRCAFITEENINEIKLEKKNYSLCA